MEKRLNTNYRYTGIKTLLKRVLLISLLFITACSVQGDYLPEKSDYYTIENKSILFQNSDLQIKVSGQCSRPDIYSLASKFNIDIQTKSDSLNVSLYDINMAANNNKFFNRYVRSGPNGDSQAHYNLMPDHEYTFSIEGILFDSLLVEFNDNLQGVGLSMDGISVSGNLINIPVFLFRTDTTVFNIVE